MAIINGYSGTLTIGGNILDFVGAWSFEAKRDIKKTGPYITSSSTGAQSKAIGALDGTGSLEGDVFTGTATARTALVNAVINGTRLALNLVQTGGLTLDASQAIISGVKVETKSDDVAKVSFDFEIDGSFTL